MKIKKFRQLWWRKTFSFWIHWRTMKWEGNVIGVSKLTEILKSAMFHEKQENENNKTNQNSKANVTQPKTSQHIRSWDIVPQFPSHLAMNKAWKLHTWVSLINKYWNQAEWVCLKFQWSLRWEDYKVEASFRAIYLDLG